GVVPIEIASMAPSKASCSDNLCMASSSLVDPAGLADTGKSAQALRERSPSEGLIRSPNVAVTCIFTYFPAEVDCLQPPFPLVRFFRLPGVIKQKLACCFPILVLGHRGRQRARSRQTNESAEGHSKGQSIFSRVAPETPRHTRIFVLFTIL